MLRKMLILAFGLGLSFGAIAQEASRYECTLGGNVRVVEIFYETGVAVPCEVHYVKETEAAGAREVLWRAQNESGYCETRTREFIDRLEGFGWECAAAAAPSADDTDVLGAASDDD